MILELKNIDKSFGEKEVLRGVSFAAEGGKAFGLLGRNGAGKTTSIRIIKKRQNEKSIEYANVTAFTYG